MIAKSTSSATRAAPRDGVRLADAGGVLNACLAMAFRLAAYVRLAVTFRLAAGVRLGLAAMSPPREMYNGLVDGTRSSQKLSADPF